MEKREKGSKWIGTYGLSNSFWIKKFTTGIKIKKKGQQEISLNETEAIFTAICLKEYPPLYSKAELELIYQKLPETRNFIERIIRNELSYEDMKKIRGEYEKNQKIKGEIIENLR